MNVVFLISFTPNPRIIKRFDLLSSCFETKLIYWNRTEEYIWGLKSNDQNLIEIKIPSTYGNPLKRIFPTLRFLIKALRKLKAESPDALYVQNLDMLFIAKLYNLFRVKKKRIIYEVSDMHRLIIDKQKKNFSILLQKCLKIIEKNLVKHIHLLVVTSEKFYKDYYHKFVPQDKYLFIPNMPEIKYFKDYKKKQTTDCKIGFIGTIRYNDQMKMLIEATFNTSIGVVFAGSALSPEIQKMSEMYNHVEYLGPYNYKSDIHKLYGLVDCIYSVYDASLSNVRIAIPNKLYEAIYCEIPIIVAEDTYLAEIVSELNVGVAVKYNSVEELKSILLKLKNDDDFYHNLVTSCKNHKSKIHIDFFHNELLSRISI